MSDNGYAQAGVVNGLVKLARGNVGADTKLAGLEHDCSHSAGFRLLRFQQFVQPALRWVELERLQHAAFGSDLERMF